MNELNDKQLSTVSGGMTTAELKVIFDRSWQKVPEEIRDKILEAYDKYGQKAAYSLGEKLLAKLDWAKPMLDLLKK